MTEEGLKNLHQDISEIKSSIGKINEGFSQHWKDDAKHFAMLKVGILVVIIVITAKGSVNFMELLGILKAFAFN